VTTANNMGLSADKGALTSKRRALSLRQGLIGRHTPLRHWLLRVLPVRRRNARLRSSADGRVSSM